MELVKTVLTITGVEMGDDRLIGYISSKQIVENFGPSWLPEYQRGRIESRKKINALKKIFVEHKNIDSIKINLADGDWTTAGKLLTLTGHVHLIDGQQRVCALSESGVIDFNVPVEVYVGLSYSEELKLFHQFNEKATKLSLAELLRSYESLWSDLLRRVLKVRSLPMKVTTGVKQSGISAIQYCTLLYWVASSMLGRQSQVRVPMSSTLKKFMRDSQPRVPEVQIVEVAVRRILQSYVATFGDFDYAATAYKRPVLLAWCHILVDNFLCANGTLDFDGFEKKIHDGSRIVSNALLQEYARDTTTYGHYKMYNYLVDKYFNKNVRKGALLAKIEFTDEDLSGVVVDGITHEEDVEPLAADSYS